ncbi:uncharacterized protein LOC141913282 [Tubulanus polymorphus]|uniref:uncharacterized protein LOC141913282 n=1 Tax=Tubulanus polymorphus TaxID=672921 RepID=UPI003DA1CD20
MEPLYEDFLEIPEPYPEEKVLFGIDIGGSLTKLAYLQKNDGNGKYSCEERPTKICMVTFPNGDIDAVVHYIKDNVVKGSANAKVYGIGCGLGSMKYKSAIDEKLGIDLEKNDEFECFSRGFRYCRLNLKEHEYVEPYNDPELSALPTANVFTNDEIPQSDTLQETEKDFPIVMCFIGSGCGFLRIEKDGSHKMMMGLGLGGLYYHGVGKLLTGAKSYDELLNLAKKGNSENVNVLFEEIVTDQYGEIDPASFGAAVLPYKMEGYPFGRIVREGLDPKPEDLARTLMDDITMNILFWCNKVCKENGVNHCYFAGSFLRNNEPFRTYTNTRMPYMSAMIGNHHVYPRIFKYNGYPGVLGAVFKLFDRVNGAKEDI